MKRVKVFGTAFVAHVMIIITCEALWMVIEGNPLSIKSWETIAVSMKAFTLGAICFWVAMLAFSIACKLTYTVVDQMVNLICDTKEKMEAIFSNDGKDKESNGIEVKKTMMPIKKLTRSLDLVDGI